MNRQEAAESGTAGTQHPAFQALLKHAMACLRCTEGVQCVTGCVLVKTLREASGEDA